MPDNPKINFCPLCGTRVSPSDKICTKCEYDLADYQLSIIKSFNKKQSTTNVISTENTTANKEKKSSSSFIVIGILIMIAVANYIFNNPQSDSSNNPSPEISSPVVPTNETPIKPETPQPTETPQPAVIPALGENWIKDENNNIYVWNPYPNDKETISWSGGYVQDGDYRYADGSGILIWYTDGKLTNIEEGYFEHGKPHGHIVYKFPDGSIKEADWNHGEEVQQSKTSIKPAEEEARQAFIHYHQAITDKNYTEAYSMLSTEQKQRVGNLSTYSAGYINTISSTVEDLILVASDSNSFTFDYKLVARDQSQENAVKAQLFNGQVTMIFNDNRWVIASARSQKSEEWLESNKIHRRN